MPAAAAAAAATITVAPPSTPTGENQPYLYTLALSTVFVPPISCENLPLTVTTDATSRTLIFRDQKLAHTLCLPSGYQSGGSDSAESPPPPYSPGRCPQGYKTFLLSDNVPTRGGTSTPTLKDGETAAVCCPRGYTWPTSVPTGTAKQYCLSQLATSTTGVSTEPTASSGDNRTASMTVGIAPGMVYAHAVQIRWKAEDFAPAVPTSFSRDSTTNNITTSSRSRSHNGLSRGGIVGMSIAVAVAAVALLLFVLFLLFRRRQRRQAGGSTSGGSTTGLVGSKGGGGGGHRRPEVSRVEAPRTGGWVPSAASTPEQPRPTSRGKQQAPNPSYPVKGTRHHHRSHTRGNRFRGESLPLALKITDANRRSTSPNQAATNTTNTTNTTTNTTTTTTTTTVRELEIPADKITVDRLAERNKFLMARINSLGRRNPTPIPELPEEEDDSGIEIDSPKMGGTFPRTSTGSSPAPRVLNGDEGASACYTQLETRASETPTGEGCQSPGLVPAHTQEQQALLAPD